MPPLSWPFGTSPALPGVYPVLSYLVHTVLSSPKCAVLFESCQFSLERVCKGLTINFTEPNLWICTVYPAHPLSQMSFSGVYIVRSLLFVHVCLDNSSSWWFSPVRPFFVVVANSWCCRKKELYLITPSPDTGQESIICWT
jgi:hypothetical protein